MLPPSLWHALAPSARRIGLLAGAALVALTASAAGTDPHPSSSRELHPQWLSASATADDSLQGRSRGPSEEVLASRSEWRAQTEQLAAERSQVAAQAQAEAQAAADAMAAADAAAAAQAAAAAAAATYDAQVAAAVADPRGTGAAMAAAKGWTGPQFSCLDSLWTRESGWDYQATNASSGAYGIPQSLPASKLATSGSDWRTNPATQIAWGLAYIDRTYGAPCSAWAHSQAVGWY